MARVSKRTSSKKNSTKSATSGKSTPPTKSSTSARARQPKQVASAPIESVITEDMVRVRAYEIYCGRGCTPGDPNADWLQAEAELRSGV